MLDFLLKKSITPTPQSHSEAGENNLLRKTERITATRAKKKKTQKTAATHELQGFTSQNSEDAAYIAL